MNDTGFLTESPDFLATMRNATTGLRRIDCSGSVELTALATPILGSFVAPGFAETPSNSRCRGATGVS